MDAGPLGSPHQERKREGWTTPTALSENVKILTTRLQVGYNLASLYFDTSSKIRHCRLPGSIPSETLRLLQPSFRKALEPLLPQMLSPCGLRKATTTLGEPGPEGSKPDKVQLRPLQWSLFTNWKLKIKFCS